MIRDLQPRQNDQLWLIMPVVSWRRVAGNLRPERPRALKRVLGPRLSAEDGGDGGESVMHFNVVDGAEKVTLQIEARTESAPGVCGGSPNGGT